MKKILKNISFYHWFLVLSFTLVWIWAAINPVFPHDWLLENYLIFIFVPVILIYSYFHKLSDVSLGLITLFMMLHVVGSHYTYAHVPFGYTLEAWLHESRNMYDRLVHFAFGFLLFYPLLEIFEHWAGVKKFWGYYITFMTIAAFGGMYEVMEWMVGSVVDPEAGMAFLGAQGDIWDSQKDIWMGVLGALVAALLMFISKKLYTVSEFSKN